ncbi:MAG TPA: hypothetical protein VKW78_10760 [Terriglobales bacterium]|nr:hypothetical protein [Terriglobales bacterium]
MVPERLVPATADPDQLIMLGRVEADQVAVAQAGVVPEVVAGQVLALDLAELDLVAADRRKRRVQW